jgi:hypothetical protein
MFCLSTINGEFITFIDALNPINCKECQTCGYKFYRKQNATNMLKNLAKLGVENYAYLDTVSYNKGKEKSLSIILNKTRTFYQGDENTSLK